MHLFQARVCPTLARGYQKGCDSLAVTPTPQQHSATMNPAARPATPPGESRASMQSEWPTPRRAEIQAVIAFAQWKGLEIQKSDVFRWAGVSKQVGWRCLSAPSPRRLSRNPTRPEVRGRPRKMSNAQIDAVDRFLQTAGLAGRALSWGALATEMGLPISINTLRRTMATLDYRKCMACQKG